jgi:DNA-binding ferritin-like protein
MITDTLKIALANHIEASFTVHGYHWNVEGILFSEYHDLFGDIYSDYYEQIDRLAEYIRIVSKATEYVNASVDVTKLNMTVKSIPVVGNKPKEMVLEIIILNDQLIDNFKTIFKSATLENIEGLANYCADRLDVLNKLNWKLLATAK